jgi:hypothetical protein
VHVVVRDARHDVPVRVPDSAFPMARATDPSDKNGHRPTIHLPSGKKYKGEWSANKMHGACPLHLAEVPVSSTRVV